MPRLYAITGLNQGRHAGIQFKFKTSRKHGGPAHRLLGAYKDIATKLGEGVHKTGAGETETWDCTTLSDIPPA